MLRCKYSKSVMKIIQEICFPRNISTDCYTFQKAQTNRLCPCKQGSKVKLHEGHPIVKTELKG